MVLTEAYFRKISSLMLPAESRALQETLAEAQRVLREAHSKGVELEWMVEVRNSRKRIGRFQKFLVLELKNERSVLPGLEPPGAGLSGSEPPAGGPGGQHPPRGSGGGV